MLPKEDCETREHTRGEAMFRVECRMKDAFVLVLLSIMEKEIVTIILYTYTPR